jgi:hypothetical protein
MPVFINFMVIKTTHACNFVCLISVVSPQDAHKTESELFTKIYSERKKKEVQGDATFSTIPQFYFKVWCDSALAQLTCFVVLFLKV